MATVPVDVAILVKGQNKLDKLQKQVDRLDKEFGQLARGSNAAANGIRRTGRAAADASRGVSKLVVGLGRLVTAYGAVRLAQGSLDAGIDRVESERKIRILAQAYGEVDQLATAAARSARKFGISQTEANVALANTYARLRPVGVSLKDIESTFAGFQTAARLSGATAVETTNAFRQLAQGLGSGALRGDEFRSVAEQAPAVLQAISQEAGVAVGELREFAAEGKLTSDIVIRALKRIEVDGASKLAEVLKGPRQQIKNLQNAGEDLAAAIGKALLPETTALLGALTGLVNQLTAIPEPIGKAALALGGAAAAMWALQKATAAFLASKLAAFLKVQIGLFKAFGASIYFAAAAQGVMTKATLALAAAMKLLPFAAIAGGLAWIASSTWKAYSAQQAFQELLGSKSYSEVQAEITRLNEEIAKLEATSLRAAAGMSLMGGAAEFSQAKLAQLRTKVRQLKDVLSELDPNNDPNKPTIPTLPTGGGGGGDDKKAAANKKAAEDLLRTLQQQLAVVQAKEGLDSQILRVSQQYEQDLQRISELKDQTLAKDQKELALRLRNQQINKLVEDAEKKRLETLNGKMLAFEREIELSNAKTEEARRLLEIEHQILDLKDQGILKTDQEVEAYRRRAQAASEAANPGKIKRYLQETNDWLNDTEGRVVDLATSMETSLADAFGSVIDGSKSTQEAFRDMFQGIAKSFIQMATQMIAKMIIMSVLNKALGGILGGGASAGAGAVGSSGFDIDGSLAPGANAFKFPIFGFADGGKPPVGRPSIVGEAGPELFVPSSSGTIVPNDQLGMGSGGDVQIVQNFYVGTSGSDSTSASGKGQKEEMVVLARMMETTALGVINRERRPGGVLSR